jgi:hypothetical protein
MCQWCSAETRCRRRVVSVFWSSPVSPRPASSRDQNFVVTVCRHNHIELRNWVPEEISTSSCLQSRLLVGVQDSLKCIEQCLFHKHIIIIILSMPTVNTDGYTQVCIYTQKKMRFYHGCRRLSFERETWNDIGLYGCKSWSANLRRKRGLTF